MPRRRATAGRLALAVAASAGLHLWAVALLALDAPRFNARAAGGRALEARLEIAQPATAEVPAPIVAPRPRAAPDSVLQKGQAVARVHAVSVEPVAPALPTAPDPVYYSARDLDVYPQPVVPLDLARIAGGTDGRHRLTLLIDETGRVTMVAAADGGRPQEELRAALAAIPFHPARRDGRAVRSRVLLEFDLTNGAAARR